MYSIILCWFTALIKTLTQLDLQYNRIGNTGARCLADALKHNAVCLVLHHIWCIYMHIISSQTLITLNLGGNDIDFVGQIYLADALQWNRVWSLIYSYIYWEFNHSKQTIITLTVGYMYSEEQNFINTALQHRTVRWVLFVFLLLLHLYFLSRHN